MVYSSIEPPGQALSLGLLVRRNRTEMNNNSKEEPCDQPRVSALLKGAWKDFSMDMLLTLATRAGLKPVLHLADAQKRRAA